MDATAPRLEPVAPRERPAAPAPGPVRDGGLAPRATAASDAPPPPGARPAHQLRAELARPSVFATLRAHLDGVARHLELLGHSDALRHTGLTRAAMSVPALASARRDVGAMQSRFWANRVSREQLVGRRGEITGAAHDHTLRSEAASFWVETRVAAADGAALAARPRSDQLAATIQQTLRRLAEHKAEARIADVIDVRLWHEGRPYALTVPLALIEGDPSAARRAIAAVLRRFALDGGASALPDSVQLTPAAAVQLQASAYGRYERHDAMTRALLDADVAFVLDPQASLDALHAPDTPWVTGGARMKEVHVYAFAPGAGGGAQLSGAATRTGHVWWDGLDAQRGSVEDLRGLPAALPVRGPAPTLELRGLPADALPITATWARALADDALPATIPHEWAAQRAIPAATVGWAGGADGWAARVSALRERSAGQGDPLRITLPDLYAKAHPLAAGAAHAHTLFSGEVLDLVYDAHPAALNAAMERMFALCADRGITRADALTDGAWAALEETHGGELDRAADILARGFGLFHEEKTRAREGRSTMSFFAALADFRPRVEDVFSAISGQPALVGKTLTRAIAQPAGMSSNTAGSRGVDPADLTQPSPRAFYTAASDAYRPNDARQLREPWAGVLGIGEQPGEGHLLTLRVLPDQAWPQIAAAIDALPLSSAQRGAARAVVEAEVLTRAPDPARLRAALARAGLADHAASIVGAIDDAVRARLDAQLARTELAVELVLRCLERRVMDA